VPKLVMTDLDRTYLVDLPEGESLTLGRSASCDLPVAARRASRRHCEVVAIPGGHRLRDLESTNGTVLNGAPFSGEADLSDGDRVEAGGLVFVYRRRP
jgi:pSer/pThr/pTyr-binding forkhead associated (FHA) protein